MEFWVMQIVVDIEKAAGVRNTCASFLCAAAYDPSDYNPAYSVAISFFCDVRVVLLGPTDVLARREDQ